MIKKYEKYKESEIEWVGNIPTHWKPSKLKYYANVITGNTPSTCVEEYFSDDKGVPWVKPSDLAEFNTITTSKQRLTEKGLLQSRLVRKGSVLVGGIGDIGKLGVAGCDLTTNQQIHSIEGNLNKIEDDYLKYLLYSSIDELQKNSSSVVLSILTKTKLLDLEIVMPTDSEQSQIASFLDHQTVVIDDLIGQKEKLIALLKEKRQAIINEAVTKGLNPHANMKNSGIEWLGEVPEHWKVITFKRIVKIRNGKDQKPVQIEEGGYPVLGTGGEFGRASEYLYDKPSVLLGRKGTIDKPQFIEIPFWTVDTLFYTEINNDCDPLYVYYLSQLIPFNLLQESSAVPSMTQDNLNNVILCKPPLKEQQEISVILKCKLIEFDGLIKKSNLQIGNLKSYRQSLISEAVTGKIDVRDWDDNSNLTGFKNLLGLEKQIYG